MTTKTQSKGVKVKTKVKAGRLSANHNETMASSKEPKGIRVKSQVKAGGGSTSLVGGITANHNQTLVRN